MGGNFKHGKDDIAVHYGGKGWRHCMINLHLGDCFQISLRYILRVSYVCFVVASVTFIYYAFWAPYKGIWRNALIPSSKEYKKEAFINKFTRTEASMDVLHLDKEDSVLTKEVQERVEYDRLMHYILHPQAPCIKHCVLGGRVWKNGKLDGDKVLCLDPGPGFSEDCIVYTFGTNNEWSFDESIHNRFGCKVYAFDPSGGRNDHLHSDGIWFYHLGIGEFDEKKKVGDRIWNIKTFDSILEQLGHRNKTIDVIKMDIEGAEFAVMENILGNGLLNQVNHLCIEIHLENHPWSRALKFLKRIEEEAGLRHFSTQNNTQAPLKRVSGFPSRYEQHLFEMAWYRP